MSKFNVNYQLNSNLKIRSQSSLQSPLLAITPHHSVNSLSKQHILLSHTQKQQTLVLANYLINVIEVLKTFRTLNEHIDEIRQFMGLDHSAVADIKNVIQQLQDNGFILDANACLQNAQSGKNYRPLQEAPLVVVRTAGRVTMLKRFLQSAVENEHRYNVHYNYVIIDDSTPEQAEANAVNINASGLNIRHLDRTKQQRLIEHWTREFADDADAIQYLLGEHPLHKLSPTYGRSWNWGILLSAGQPTVFLDDDCLLEAYAPPVATNQYVSFGELAQEVVFLDKNKPLNQQLQSISLDPIAKLTEVLGMTPQQLPCQAISLKHADNSVTEKLDKAHVMISHSAIAGDPGSATPMWLYYMRGKSAKRFWGDNEKAYQRHKSERFLWVGDTQPQLAFGGSYSVVARAFDNRQLLPPTLPIFRNEDALFTNLIHYLYPNGATLASTWALSHLPETERRWTDKNIFQGKAFDIVIALNEIIDAPSQLPHAEKSPSVRLAQLSLALKDLLSADDSELRQWQYRHQQATRGVQVTALQRALEDNAKAPEYWQKDVHAIISANIGNDDNQGLNFGNTTPEQALEALRQFAKALPVWERLWSRSQREELLTEVD